MEFNEFVQVESVDLKGKCGHCKKKTYAKLKNLDVYACHAFCLWNLWEKHNIEKNLGENYMEELIAKKINDVTENLGITFKVKKSFKKFGIDYLIRIKDNGLDADKLKEFTDHCYKIVVPEYSNHVRFSYPKKL